MLWDRSPPVRKLAIDLKVGVIEEVERLAVVLDSRRPVINNDGRPRGEVSRPVRRLMMTCFSAEAAEIMDANQGVAVGRDQKNATFRVRFNKNAVK